MKNFERRDPDKDLEVIQKHPELHFEWLTPTYATQLLHDACFRNCHQVVPVLLKVKDIDINHHDERELSPFYQACLMDSVESLALLLNDPRLDLVACDSLGRHALYYSFDWCTRLLPLWIASGRPIEPKSQIETSIKVLRHKRGREDDVKLLESYLEHPRHAAFRASMQLGKPESIASLFLAPVIFLSDGLLQLKKEREEGTDEKKMTRFLSIARVLPMELQMTLCHRVVDSRGVNIPASVSEVAFQQLAQIYNHTVCSCFL
jgi:hypothetical protein